MHARPFGPQSARASEYPGGAGYSEGSGSGTSRSRKDAGPLNLSAATRPASDVSEPAANW